MRPLRCPMLLLVATLLVALFSAPFAHPTEPPKAQASATRGTAMSGAPGPE